MYLWLSEETSEEPVQILAEHHYAVLAAALLAAVNAPEKQRGGVFGTAREMCAFMTNRQAMAWVTPPPHPAPEFDPGGVRVLERHALQPLQGGQGGRRAAGDRVDAGGVRGR